MIWDVIAGTLVRQGYVKSAGNAAVADFLIKVSNDKMQICSIVKNVNGLNISAEQIRETADHLERKFLLGGYKDVEVMHIIVTDHKEDVIELQESGVDFWIVDTSLNRLMIYENQPEDYGNLKAIIEKSLQKESVVVKEEKKIPFVTYSLVAINIFIFLILEIMGDTEDAGFMLRAGASNYIKIYNEHQYYRLFTCMFLHFGFMHIANNMFMLAIIGEQIENVFGKVKYLMLYIVSGIGASVFSAVFHMLIGEDAVSAGASGAIYGIMGALIVIIYKNRRTLNSMSTARISAVVLLLLIGSIQPEVDFMAHLGGLLIGIILTCVTYKPHLNSKKFSI